MKYKFEDCKPTESCFCIVYNTQGDARLSYYVDAVGFIAGPTIHVNKCTSLLYVPEFKIDEWEKVSEDMLALR